jgi:hypothetical protein
MLVRPLHHQQVAVNTSVCALLFPQFSFRVLNLVSCDDKGSALDAGRHGPGGAARRGHPGAQGARGEECGSHQQAWPSKVCPQVGTAVHLLLVSS